MEGTMGRERPRLLAILGTVALAAVSGAAEAKEAGEVSDARGGFRGAAAPGRAAERRAADSAGAGLGVGRGRARGGAADRAGVRRGVALPALRCRAAAALGLRQRAAPLPLRNLPEDLQRPDRHLAGAVAEEGVLAALRRGARGRDEPDEGGRPLRRAPDDQLPLAAPLPAGAGGDARGAGWRG